MEFVEAAFGLVGLDWQKYVQIDDAYMRPADVAELRGDPSKAMARLGWAPTVTFDELVYEMLENDLKLEGVDPTKHLHKPI
jgi:GDPmannose 4,6-dehydratase